MSTTLDQKLSGLTAERRQGILDEANRLHHDYMLRQIRQARKLTQQQLAEMLFVRQPSIAIMEKQHDFLLSTLNKWVKAMGGKMDVVIRFPDEQTYIVSDPGVTEKKEKTQKAVSQE
ncbi:MAG: XRE family transcriptional regulator [Candidatus Puniceispirillales bacterium]